MYLAQAETIANKALDTITQAIQGGLVGVAIILSAALIISVLVIALAIRSNGKNLSELLNYIGRLTSTNEKLETGIDKIASQTTAQSVMFGELAVTMKESGDRTVGEIGLMRKDLRSFTMLNDDTVTGFRVDLDSLKAEMVAQFDRLDRRVARIKPDTQPITPITVEPPNPPTLPTQSTDLLVDKNETGET